MRLRLLLIALCATAVKAFCPAFLKVPSTSSACSCTDYVDGAIIKCNGPNGTIVVEELKKAQVEVRELTLENANIVEIGPRAFKNLRIKKLVLDNNRINKIHADAFRGLEGVLQELSIASNNLTEVPTEAMEGLRTLNIVNLRCNKIGNLTDVSFMNMPSLIEINLGCNQICKIGSKAFKEIKTTIQNVILDNNCLEHIPTKALDGMQFLIALHAKYNNIEKLARHELRNLTSLSMLTLTGNKISYMDKEFVQNAPNVRYIYMGENELKSIESGTLQQFKQAEILDLSYNDLPEITADLFQGLEMLQHLNLEGNSIRDIATGAFQSMPLLLLWLPYNCLTAVTSKMFQGAPFLKQVSLAHNNIRSIEQFSFAHLANLHTLDLSHNKLMTVQQTALQGTDFLTIRMQENPMVCNQDGFHVMNGHEAINLTTEANLICHTDYVHDLTDKCPTRKDMPVRPPCCQSQMRRLITTTTAPMTKAPTSVVPESEAPVTEEVMAVEEEQTEATTQARRLPLGVEAARRFNMERFRKLSRRPMDPLGVVVRGAPPQTNDLNLALDSTRPRQVIRANLPTLLPKATEVGASEVQKEASSSSAMVDFSSDDAPQVAQKEEMAMHRS